MVDANIIFDREIAEATTYYGGQAHIFESVPGNFGIHMGAESLIVTGGTNGFLSDLAYTSTGLNLNLASTSVPSSLRMYPYQWQGRVNGVTPWAGGTGVSLEDQNGSCQGFLPLTAMLGLSSFVLPGNQTIVPLVATVSSFNSSTGAFTLPSSTLINGNTLTNYPYTIISGPGAGQGGIVLTNTATVVTPTHVLPSTGNYTTPTSSSVIAFPYYIATAGGATSITASNGAFTSSALIGYYVVIVGGTGVGQFRQITANNTTALTVATWTTNPDTTSVFMITSNPFMLGAVDLNLSGQLSGGTGIGTGLRLVPYGTMSQGSSIRSTVRTYLGQ